MYMHMYLCVCMYIDMHEALGESLTVLSAQMHHKGLISAHTYSNIHDSKQDS